MTDQPRRCDFCGGPYRPGPGLLATCSRCGHQFRSYDGDPIAFHEQDYRKSFRRRQDEFDVDGRPNDKFHSARGWIVRRRIRLVRKLLRPTDHCLDIGAGAGTFARAVLPRVASVECTELDPNLIAESERLGFRTFRGDFAAMTFEQTYDVVFAWHVLEHVADAMSFVDKARQLASRLIVFEVPVRRRCPSEFDGHYHYFNELSLSLAVGQPSIVWLRDGVQKPALCVAAKANPEH